MSQDLNKLAAVAIRQLRSENEDLRQKLASVEEAEKLTFDLFKIGAISAEDLENKLSELKTKTHEEREIIKQATKLTRNQSHPFKLGSDEIVYSQSAEERFLNALINPED